MAKKKKQKDTRDKLYAKVAFYISLGFWIPLFNIGLCIIALCIAIKAVIMHFKEPKKYGGFGYAVAAIVLSLTSLILTAIGGIVFLLQKK